MNSITKLVAATSSELTTPGYLDPNTELVQVALHKTRFLRKVSEIMRELTRNAAKCLLCGDIVESRSVHDSVTCSCGNISVDGGLYYAKRCFKEYNTWEELCEWEEVEDTVPEEDDGSEISFYFKEGDEYE